MHNFLVVCACILGKLGPGGVVQSLRVGNDETRSIVPLYIFDLPTSCTSNVTII